MPELPEVEVLVRHLRPLLQNRVVRAARVRRPKVLAPTSARQFKNLLRGARFLELSRRGKYLLFTLRPANSAKSRTLVGHLGMTGRMYLLPARAPLPKHAAVVLDLGHENFVFEDTRYFGHLTFDTRGLEKLGPEPLEPAFTVASLAAALRSSSQAVKVKLLDQTVVAGVGNIYASEALFRARLSPTLPARSLRRAQVECLWQGIRDVLAEAVRCGSTVPLNFSGSGKADGLFYFGRTPGAPDYYAERLLVYDRANQPCPNCGEAIQRLTQAARSTYYCPRCQA